MSKNRSTAANFRAAATAFGCFAIITVAAPTGCSEEDRRQVETCLANKFHYSREQQRQAADELRKLGDDAALAVFMADYGKIREICRRQKI